jgi:signal peptidase
MTGNQAPSRPRPRGARRLIKAAGTILANVALLVAMVFGALMIGPAAFGYHRYVILTGSMTGTYDRGSIVYDRSEPVDQLKVGDPITYSPPPGFSSHSLVTHRIFRIGHGQDGVKTYRTKGDANRVADVWTFQLGKPTQDVVKFHVPYAGYVFAVLSIRRYRMFLIGIPAILVALTVVRGLWREAGEEARRQASTGWGEISELHAPDTGLAMLPADGASPTPVSVVLPQGMPAPRRAELRRRRSARVAHGPRVIHLRDLQIH